MVFTIVVLNSDYAKTVWFMKHAGYKVSVLHLGFIQEYSHNLQASSEAYEGQGSQSLFHALKVSVLIILTMQQFKAYWVVLPVKCLSSSSYPFLLSTIAILKSSHLLLL